MNAVELSYSKANLVELANESSIRPELLYRWRSELSGHQGKKSPGNGKPKLTDEESEVSC